MRLPAGLSCISDDAPAVRWLLTSSCQDGRCSDEVNPRKQPYKMSNQKLRDLGLKFRPVSQSLYETVKNLQEKGHLPVLAEQEAEKKALEAELQGGIAIRE